MFSKQIAGNAGWRLQFRFAVHTGWSRVPDSLGGSTHHKQTEPKTNHATTNYGGTRRDFRSGLSRLRRSYHHLHHSAFKPVCQRARASCERA